MVKLVTLVECIILNLRVLALKVVIRNLFNLDLSFDFVFHPRNYQRKTFSSKRGIFVIERFCGQAYRLQTRKSGLLKNFYCYQLISGKNVLHDNSNEFFQSAMCRKQFSYFSTFLSLHIFEQCSCFWLRKKKRKIFFYVIISFMQIFLR